MGALVWRAPISAYCLPICGDYYHTNNPHKYSNNKDCSALSQFPWSEAWQKLTTKTGHKNEPHHDRTTNQPRTITSTP